MKVDDNRRFDPALQIVRSIEEVMKLKNYNLEFSSFANGAGSNIPTEIKLTCSYSNENYRFIYTGYQTEKYCIRNGKPLEIIRHHNTSYIHGPIPAVFANQNDWYIIPEEYSIIPLNWQYILRSLSYNVLKKYNFTLEEADFNQQTCNVYSADKKGVLNLINVINAPEPMDEVSPESFPFLKESIFKFWINTDGILIKLEVSMVGQDKNDDEGVFKLNMRFHEIDRAKNIEKPQNVIDNKELIASHFQTIKLGEHADDLLHQGKYPEALEAYQNVLNHIKKSGNIISYFLSKTCLGLMITNIKQSKSEAFAEIFTSNIENPDSNKSYGIGMLGLDNAMVSERDCLTFVLLHAFFHSIRNDLDKNEKVKALTEQISYVCDNALRSSYNDVFEIAINRWRLHLLCMFGENIPSKYIDPISMFESQYGREVPFSPKAMFPLLDKWRPGIPKLTFQKEGGAVQIKDSTGWTIKASTQVSEKKAWWKFW